MNLEKDVKITIQRHPVEQKLMSDFLCESFFYEYHKGCLSKKDRLVFEKSLESSQKVKEQYSKFQKSIKCCEVLGSARVAEKTLVALKETLKKKQVSQLKTLWEKTPETVKILLQSMTVALTAAFFVVYFPWPDLGFLASEKTDQSVELARLSVELDDEERDFQETMKVAHNESRNSPEEESPSVSSKKSADLKSENKPQVSQPVKATKSAKAEKTVQTTAAKEKPKTTPAVREGYVYRAFMDVEKIDQKAESIAQKIKSMGGTKAGKVELGWKTKGGRYFHFSLDQNKYDEILSFLKEFAPVRISKDAHRRIMPEGKERFILWIENK